MTRDSVKLAEPNLLGQVDEEIKVKEEALDLQ